MGCLGARHLEALITQPELYPFQSQYCSASQLHASLSLEFLFGDAAKTH